MFEPLSLLLESSGVVPFEEDGGVIPPWLDELPEPPLLPLEEAPDELLPPLDELLLDEESEDDPLEEDAPDPMSAPPIAPPRNGETERAIPPRPVADVGVSSPFCSPASPS